MRGHENPVISSAFLVRVKGLSRIPFIVNVDNLKEANFNKSLPLKRYQELPPSAVVNTSRWYLMDNKNAVHLAFIAGFRIRILDHAGKPE